MKTLEALRPGRWKLAAARSLQLTSAIGEAHLRPRSKPGALRRWAEQRLVQVLRRAYHEVPYYQEVFHRADVEVATLRARDLSRLPVLSKAQLIANFPDRLVARGTNLEACVHATTTGSSGTVARVVFDQAAYAYYLAAGLRVYTMVGYRPWHKFVYIKHGPVELPNVRVGNLFRVVQLSSLLPIGTLLHRLREEKPDVLVGYASVIIGLAHAMAAEGRHNSPRPRMVFVNSEPSSREERDFISSTFGCPVYDEYSSEEVWMIASQCRHKAYHLATDSLWVEILGPNGQEVAPGEVGEIVVTTLRSRALPLIRYRLGDLGRKGTFPCPCGSALPTLAGFEGRIDDAFLLPSGRRLPSVQLLNVLASFVKGSPGHMREFFLVQHAADEALLKAVKGTHFERGRHEVLLRGLRDAIGEPFTLRTSFVSAIDRRGGGKRKAVASLVERGEGSREKAAFSPERLGRTPAARRYHWSP